MLQHSLQVISLTRPQRPHAPKGRCPMNCSKSPVPLPFASPVTRSRMRMQPLTAATGHFFLLICVFVASFQVTLCVQGMHIDYSRTCEPIKIEMCKNNGYNVTAMPNFVGHELQSEAEIQLATFTPLIQYGCSSQLKFFLCSVYTPICNDKIPFNIGPCRPMCQTVRDRCQPVLKEFGFQWPPSLNCDIFPIANNNEHMCIEGPGESDASPPLSSSPSSATEDNDDSYGHDLPVNRKKVPSSRTGSVDGDSGLMRNLRKGHKINPECGNLKQSHEYFYVNRTATCVQKCDSDVLFSKENKAFAQNWLMFWSISCLVTTLLAIVVFVRDSTRFRYPERMIIIMAISSFLSCLGYLLRLIFGRESVSCYLESQHQIQLLIQEGPDNVYCTIVFVLLFYFGSATFIWWVNLTVAWYLSSSLNWSSETLERKSSYFHCIAWLIPALQTLVILIIRAVDSDELTGICFVGNHSSEALLAFILIPGLLYILIGFTFLLARMYNLYYCGTSCGKNEQCTSLGIRQGSHHSCSSHAHLSQMTLSSYCSPGKDSDSLLNMCIGFIAFSYLVLYSVLLCGYGYEYLYRDLWYQSGSREIPNMEFFTIKIFLSLVIGIIAGSWIWCSTNPTIFWSGTCSTFSKKHPMSPYLLPQVVSASTYSVGGPLGTGVTNVALATVPFNSFTGSGSVAASTLLPPHSYASLRPPSNLQKTILVKPPTLDKRTRGKGGETTV